MLFEKTKINQKEAEDGPFFEKKISSPPGLIHRLDERTFVKIIISKETISALKCKKTKKNDFQLIWISEIILEFEDYESGKAHGVVKILVEKDLTQKLRILKSISTSGLEPFHVLYLILLEQDIQGPIIWNFFAGTTST